MTDREFIYLDNAATSWPKPDGVVEAIVQFYRENGTAAGRGSSRKSLQVDRMLDQCRVELARLINASSDQIVFCFNGTDGLNSAIGGVVRDGDHVVTTDIDHNSVLRPLTELADRSKIKLDVVKSNQGVVDPQQVGDAVNSATRLVCISHVSNVTGTCQDVAAISAASLESNADVLVLVDAAQSVGHIPVDVLRLGCDMLVAPGHKGLLGPLGTGFIFLSSRAQQHIRPVRFGGTGTNSESLRQPTTLPDSLESGNPNVGGIAGLLKGVQFVLATGVEQIADAEHRLAIQLSDALQQIDGVQLFGLHDSNRTGLVSFNIDQQDPQSIAMLLDSEFGIQVRAGYHCASLIHGAIGSKASGGTLRASPGVFNVESDINRLIAAVEELSTQLV